MRRQAMVEGQVRPNNHGQQAADLYPCCGSLFQGDHLGVEFALREVLRQGGLLQPEHRLQGHSIFPLSHSYEGLIIDDYFALGVEKVECMPLNSFAAKRHLRAREASTISTGSWVQLRRT